MASDFILPPTGFGPGSQDAGDGELDYMALPSGMRTYSPHIPEAEDPRTVTSAMALLGEASDAARESSQTGLRTEIDLAGAEAAVLALIADTLGEGEVSMKLLGVPALKVQESVFAGVWRLVGAGVDRIEVAPVPGEALARAHAPSRKGTGHETPKSPQVVNAPALLEEILDKSANFQRGQEPHVINLTLLPHTEADLVWLDAALGEGSVTILSRVRPIRTAST